MALIGAIDAERIHQVRLLLSNHSVDINQTDTNGQTALVKACFMKKKWKALCVANLLLKNNIDVNVMDKAKRTCLSHACILGREYLVKIFLETGDISPNTKDVDSFTNLMRAVESGNIAVVSMLLVFLNKYGLSLDARTRSGFTAYTIALKQGYFNIAELLAQKGASTETCDFETFRRSEEWRRISSRRRASTAPGVLSTNFQTLEWEKQSSHQQHSWDMLKEKSLKTPAVEIYHAPHARLTGLSEAKLLLGTYQQPYEQQSENSTQQQEKLPTINKRKISGDSIDHTQDKTFAKQGSNKDSTNNKITRNLRYSTKNIIGTLLKESVLAKTQLQEDEERHERTKVDKHKRFNSHIQDHNYLLPRIDQLSVGDPLTRENLNIHRRCLSSDPTRMRKRSSGTSKSIAGFRRTSMAS